jgi:sterol desaturase/sphingolipid hydroxylase (fatty acid hydroxylase superfamily)
MEMNGSVLTRICRYRVDGDRVGWNSPDPEVRRVYLRKNLITTRRTWWRLLTLNGFVWLFLHISHQYWGWWDQSHIELAVATTPTRWDSIWQLTIGLLLYETNFYWVHRAQHKYWYASHKVHHEYHAPNALTASWGAVFDGLVSEILPHTLIPIILGYHLYTACMVSIHFVFSIKCWSRA